MCGQHFPNTGSESIAAANRPNLIKDLVIDRPNQVWVSDITYWFTHYGCLYISLVTDAYSKRIMGYGVAPTLQAVHCKAALQMALEHIDLKTGQSLIHHSDRGLQYCSVEYVAQLDAFQIQISMTENGDPLENAIAERVNGIIKNEYLAHHVVNSVVQAQLVLQQAVFLYNYKRPHMSCNMLVPDETHKGEGKLKRWWKNYYYNKAMDSILDNECRGQYLSITFRARLDKWQCRQSMAEKENPYQNAHAESLWSRLKAELLEDECFENLQDTYDELFN